MSSPTDNPHSHLAASHRSNVLRQVYNDAPTSPSPASSPLPRLSSPRPPSSSSSSWRARVQARLKPASKASPSSSSSPSSSKRERTLARLRTRQQKRDAPLLPLSIPTFAKFVPCPPQPGPGVEPLSSSPSAARGAPPAAGQRREVIPVALQAPVVIAPTSPRGPKVKLSETKGAYDVAPVEPHLEVLRHASAPKREQSKAERLRSLAASVNERRAFSGRLLPPPETTPYVLPTDPDEVYATEQPVHVSMPLELFDDGESELHSNEEWFELGTPARARFFEKGKWRWRSCRVEDYDPETLQFVVRFDGTDHVKRLRRLALVFDGEDEDALQSRIERCRARREEAKAAQRYERFSTSWPEDGLEPIQQRTLQRLVDRLQLSPDQLVRAGELLVEVKSSFMHAMKQATIEYMRTDEHERARMDKLGLPEPQYPLPDHEDVPLLATVPIDADPNLLEVVNAVYVRHFTYYKNTVDVVLTLLDAFHHMRGQMLFDVEQMNMPLPMTLYEFKEHQDEYFTDQNDALISHWRLRVINFIRDYLGQTFHLYVAEHAAYRDSPLQRFLQMLTFVMRDQLADLVLNSINGFSRFISLYDEAAGDTPVGVKPIFVFRMSTSAGRVVMLPELSTIRTCLQNMLDLPSHLAEVLEIESEVIPVLGIRERPILSEEKCPFVFARLAEVQKQLAAIIEANLEGPHELMERYEQHAGLLTVNAEAFVHEWFARGTLASPVYRSQLLAIRRASRRYHHRMRVGNAAAIAALHRRVPESDYDALDSDDEDLIEFGEEPALRRMVEQGDLPNMRREAEEQAEWESAQLHQASPTAAEAHGSDDEEDAAAAAAAAFPLEQPHTLEETQAELQRLQDTIEQVQCESASEVPFRMIVIQCQMVKESLIRAATNISQRLLEGLSLQARQQNTAIRAQFEHILTQIHAQPQSPGELAELKEFSQAVERVEIPRLIGEMRAMQGKMQVLDDFCYSVAREDFELSWDVMRYPQQVLDSLNRTKETVADVTDTFQKDLTSRQSRFKRELGKIEEDIGELQEMYRGPQDLEDCVKRVDKLRKKLDDAEEKRKVFNEEEIIFGLAPSEYDKLQELQEQFEPYGLLYSTVSEFAANVRGWSFQQSFIELDPEHISDSLDRWFGTLLKLERTLAAEPAVLAAEQRAEVAAFRKHLPIIEALRSPGLRPRHWEQVSELLRRPITANAALTLSTILTDPRPDGEDVHDHAAAIEEIAAGADKEFALEQALDKMRAEWDQLMLTVEPYKETRTYVLKQSDDVLELLDDQIMKTQAMRGSPYIGPFEQRTVQWEERLQLIQSTMDEWLLCQQTWLYLEPIFSSDDIMRQMPTEGRRFNSVDKYWRKTMELAFQNPNLLELTETEPLLKGFRSSNEWLEMIGKGLNDYLETKRAVFPRFYFLANDELLNILSQTKNVLAVQPHMSKCFDNIATLDFDDDLIIRGMNSAQGETVAFKEPIDPNTGAMRGNVEEWLTQVEVQMRSSLRTELIDALRSYATTPREQWVLEQPGQIVLAVSQVMWTRGATRALAQAEAGNPRAMTDFVKSLNEQLKRLVVLVRGDLSKLHRLTLGALTVLDVHARDVAQELAEDRIGSDQAFEWLSKLRYYWDAEQTLLSVKMVNTSMDYGYEYLGNSSRLVITPLTDRAYATLMGAVHLHLGGAPEGPAGTGKTETVKDLAKALAIQCVVFNCSDGLDYLAMAKFFKGLASSGAWSCFDEFNRIDLEVLSVIAQQISSIQRAIVDGKRAFDFEGATIRVLPTCSVFITMNPGYAGRAELPDNLKALFRTVAMMVPDYALIAEIVLYSFGYSDARNLARKIVTCLHLSSEQLSSQDHYDFGMRNLKSILTAAGSLRRSEPDTPEALLCLRAINDCNLPKFTNSDIPLFVGITKDLFPGVELPNPDYELLVGAAKQTLGEFGLEPVPSFVTKVTQLYETICVRHGLMVVGPTFAGKSACIETLAEAISRLDGQSSFHTTERHSLNPKSVTQGQLYGEFDQNTHEWTDGVLPVIVRRCVSDTSETRHWVVFDGPVDALWIENMNTVLDDNKKLCLASGEIIKISDKMNLIFEVEDLAVASPATVSRCGMVYMEPGSLGWRPLADSFLASLPEESLGRHREQIRELFEWLVPPSLEFVRRNVKGVLPYAEMRLVAALIRLFRAHLMADFGVSPEQTKAEQRKQLKREKKLAKRKQKKKQQDEPEADAEVGDDAEAAGDDSTGFEHQDAHQWWLQGFFCQALVWSIGANTDTTGRHKFSEFFSDLIRGHPLADGIGVELPEAFVGKSVRTPYPVKRQGTVDLGVYDYLFDAHAGINGGWTYWMDTMPAFEVPASAAFHEIIVPTVDTLRTSWLLDTLIAHQSHVLLTGETGTGKSLVVQRKIVDELDREQYMPLMLSFSARTSANLTQDIIDGKLDRRRKGIMGPPLGKRCVIFVDDLNMPQREEYGAQPPIELLRQWMDYGGWYDRKTNTMTEIVDVQFIAAMGPPGGGRNPITNRYLRHYNGVCLTPYAEESLKGIYSKVMEWWLSGFATNLQRMRDKIVDATVDLYSTVTTELLPTPSKSHYTFNLRDVAAVFQGITQVHQPSVQQPIDLLRLWCHEATRVFCDRLVNDEDMSWFGTQLAKQSMDKFGVSYEDSVLPPPMPSSESGGVVSMASGRLVYADFANASAPDPQYQQVVDYDGFRKICEDRLGYYNALNAKSPMNLVLFGAAIEHVARITRVLRQPFGNLLLVGVGGSGRQSLARLAASIVEYEVFQIEVTNSYGVAEWREDLRTVMRRAGVSGKPVVFLFTDTQIKHESFIEDLNNILNNGEVPNLFAPEEKVELISEMTAIARKNGQAGSPASIYGFFVNRCRQNIHVVLCMSPIGAAFRTRLRMFPSLVNCTTIDWFHPWPTDALRSVARQFLADVSMDEEQRQGVVEVCVSMQECAVQLSDEYLAELSRHNYVTPTSYLELLQIFTSLFERKRSELLAERNRYENGLKKLEETEEEVTGMKAQLNELRPQLIESSEQTELLMKTIQERSKQVNETRTTVEAEEAVCNEQAEAARAIKDECTAKLEEAMPALHSALEALKVLKKSDLVELKSMKKPPDGVKITIKALCIMMGVKPNRVGQVGKKTNDYWTPATKTFLRDTSFITTLQEYDRDNIDPAIIEKIRPLTQSSDFQPAKVRSASRAAEGFCRWVQAMEVYDRVAKEVRPRRIALAEAEAQLAEASAKLNKKKQQLQEVQDLLDELNAQFDQVNKKKMSLEQEVNQCTTRLKRASELIDGLQGEKERWGVAAKRLRSAGTNVVGNVLISSGVIAYLGVFTSEFRQRAIDTWCAQLEERGIPCDDNFSLTKVLGDPVLIRQWGIQKLPRDDLSTDNAVILTMARRWGLMIDPQGQANAWIKNMEKDMSLVVTKQTDQRFANQVSNAVRFGLPILVENVGQTLDPLLEPILLRQTFKQGSRTMIILGGETIDYNESFRLYMTTKLANPHYPPEISTRVTMINFMITPTGLSDQMLGIVVMHEAPKLEEQRSQLIVNNAENQRQLQEIENKILQKLSESSGMILDDEELVQTLQDSKSASKVIEKKMESAAVTEREINRTRSNYKAVAAATANLFFCVSDMAKVDPMYEYSLDWFIGLFGRALDDSAPAPRRQVQLRTSNIWNEFLASIYRNVCRSLFGKHKLLFSFLLCLRVLGESVDPLELRFFLTGGIVDDLPENPAPEWLSDNVWGQIVNLGKLPSMSGFREHFETTTPAWRRFFEHNDPFSLPVPESADDAYSHAAALVKHTSLSDLTAAATGAGAGEGSDDEADGAGGAVRAPIPISIDASTPDPKFATPTSSSGGLGSGGPWNSRLSMFQRMLVLRALRPDKLVQSVQDFVEHYMGPEFIVPPEFDLESCFVDSDQCTPLVFVLSHGVDPSDEVHKFAETRGCNLESISLGQGQGPIAERAIGEAVDNGSWVLLQNCHLAVSWLPKLERIVDELDETTTDPQFRLWLTSMPSKHFPVSVLQNGVKMTNEPPKGVRANVSQTWRNVVDEELIESSEQPQNMKRLLFSLSMFHALVLERRQFGPLGWNTAYAFTESDLRISVRQLSIFLDLYAPSVPFKALNYLIGQLNYGGRVTDDWDRRTCTHILSDLLTPELLDKAFAYDDAGVYHPPSADDALTDIRRYVSDDLPLNDDPSLFGLHSNARVTSAISESNDLLQTVLSLQPKTSATGGQSREETIERLAAEIEAKLPADFDVEAASTKYPVVYENSMNTVLVQELIRFNRLLLRVRTTLRDLQKAIRGEVVMSQELEDMGDMLFNNQVPTLWQDVAYPSLKPLGSWVLDLEARLNMFASWLQDGPPGVFWISGFFFTQSFLTGTRQNYARRHKIPIDELAFDFEVMEDVQPDHAQAPENGCYIHGLFLEGARWNSELGQLDESEPNKLFTPVPVIWLKPTRAEELAKDDPRYECPLYKTSKRAGVLSTTGHSTNFVMSVRLPSAKKERHWVKRGVAMLTQLDT